MENPWRQLPNEPPFVLDIDRDSVDQFRAKANLQTTPHLELLPEPFLGRLDAPVVLLGLNPGFSPDEVRVHQSDSGFVAASRTNLVHGQQDYPFFLLDPRRSASLGWKWWSRRLRWLIEKFDELTIAQAILCVEYTPYHSRRFRNPDAPFPSQRYSVHLVRKAIEQNRLIVLMRGAQYWKAAVEGLAGYERYFELCNKQNVWVSPGNCPDNRFEEIVSAIRNAHTPA